MNLGNFLLEYLYSFSVTVSFLLVYLLFRFKVNRVEKRNLKSINKREIFDAVETDSPVNDQERKLKESGISGIEDRFSFIRKAFPFVAIPLWLFTISLPHLGNVPSVYVSIVAAVLSVVAGVALRPFLENLFSGVVISFFKSIKIGDTVIIDDHYGLVEEISLTYSVIRKWDWNRIVIPNSKLLQKEIQNLTMNDQYIWAHVEFFVAPDSDLQKVESIAKNVVKDSKYFNKSEEPSFWVMGLEKDTIKCWLAAWADNPSDAWELRNDLRTSIVKSLQKEKIKFHQHQVSTIDI